VTDVKLLRHGELLLAADRMRKAAVDGGPGNACCDDEKRA